jgi:hypothetical protein
VTLTVVVVRPDDGSAVMREGARSCEHVTNELLETSRPQGAAFDG